MASSLSKVKACRVTRLIYRSINNSSDQFYPQPKNEIHDPFVNRLSGTRRLVNMMYKMKRLLDSACTWYEHVFCCSNGVVHVNVLCMHSFPFFFFMAIDFSQSKASSWCLPLVRSVCSCCKGKNRDWPWSPFCWGGVRNKGCYRNGL